MSVTIITSDNNLMFKSVKAATEAAHKWQANDAKSLDYARAAVMFCLTHFAMHGESDKANAEPLSQWARAFEHRSKQANLGTKLKAWVKAVSPYTWRDKSNAFGLKKDAKVSDGIDHKVLEAFPAFDLFKATKEKPAFDAGAAIKRIIKRCEKEGMAKEDIAKLVSLFQSGAAPKTVLVKQSQGRSKATKGATVTATQQDETQAAATADGERDVTEEAPATTPVAA